MNTYKIGIIGMGCENCVRAVRGALEEVGAVVLDVQVGHADVSFQGDKSIMREAIESVGLDVADIIPV